MLVEIQSEWREYCGGDIVDVNEVIANQLYSSGVARILQSVGEKSSSLTALQMKNAELSRVKVMISYHELELSKLKERLDLIEFAIKELKGDSSNGVGKEEEKISKDKSLKRPNISKEEKI